MKIAIIGPGSMGLLYGVKVPTHETVVNIVKAMEGRVCSDNSLGLN